MPRLEMAEARGSSHRYVRLRSLRQRRSKFCSITPPTLTCPADINASEAPRGSGLAAIAYPPPIVVDECDPNPQVACLPPAGSAFPVGTTTVTCTLDNRAGYHLQCSFTIRVIPYILKATSLADFYRKVWARGHAGAVVPIDIQQNHEVRRVDITSMNRLDHLKLKSTF